MILSFTNFLMLETGPEVRQAIEHFKKNGVLVGRRFPPLDTWMRVSLGNPQEMRRFRQVWDTLEE